MADDQAAAGRVSRYHWRKPGISGSYPNVAATQVDSDYEIRRFALDTTIEDADVSVEQSIRIDPFLFHECTELLVTETCQDRIVDLNAAYSKQLLAG